MRCSMKHRSSKNVQKYIFYRWYSVKSKLQTTVCPFTIVPRRNRLVHRRYLVKSKLCNVTDLSALYQVGFSHFWCLKVTWFLPTRSWFDALRKVWNSSASQNERKNMATATTRKSPRFAFRQQQTNTKCGPEPHHKNPQNQWDCLRHDTVGKAHRVSEYAQNQ